jgi:hypothetical protein
MKYVDIRDLPPCALSPQCLRLLDDLDLPATPRARARLFYIDDLQDERQLRQLRSHVSGCPTCSALLAEARHTRTQQRAMLHHFLIANEQRVPAATQAIFVALRREQAQQEEAPSQKRPSRNLALAAPASSQDETSIASPLALHPRPTQLRNFFQNILTLATVVAVILAAVGLLNRASNPSASSTSPSPAHPEHPASGTNTDDWNSMVIGLTILSATGVATSFTVYSFNSANSQLETLFTSPKTISDMRLEQVSDDGQSLLYDVTSPDQQTTYTTFSAQVGSHNFYHLGAHLAGNAIWMDADHILAQSRQDVVLEVDAHNGNQQHTWPLKVGRLTFYKSPFLYFMGAQNLLTDALYRINLAQANATPQQVTARTPNPRFWLSPDGTTVFYTNKGPIGTEGIYAVSSDGTHERLLRSGPGIPIGYAKDNALMLLQQVGTRAEVIKLGETAQQKEQVVLSNVAPQATSLCGPANVGAVMTLCDQNIALVPYGHGLLLHAYYADGSHRLIYDDLATGTSRQIFTVPRNAHVQLPGWSRITSKTASAVPATLCA